MTFGGGEGVGGHPRAGEPVGGEGARLLPLLALLLALPLPLLALPAVAVHPLVILLLLPLLVLGREGGAIYLRGNPPPLPQQTGPPLGWRRKSQKRGLTV